LSHPFRIFVLYIQIMKTILYLHGLHSHLSNEKREVLELYGNVKAPQFDYFTTQDVIAQLIRQFEEGSIDCVMGSSMGGFVGYYVAQALGVPALLFNPALPYRSVEQGVPTIKTAHSATVHFVLGVKDEVIRAKDTLHFITEKMPIASLYRIYLRPELGHRIPMPVFEEEVWRFFNIKTPFIL